MSERRTVKFYQADVFTDTVFGGNPVAVVPDAGDLDGWEMQKIAREMNLSETVFVLPPTDPSAEYRLRFFTPVREIPFAAIRSSAPSTCWRIWASCGCRSRSPASI